MLKTIISSNLTKAAKEFNIKLYNFNVEKPAFDDHGDYATNIALVLAKSLKKSPMEVAQKIVTKIPETEFIKKIEIVKPGFINFYLKEEYLVKQLQEVIKKGKKFGSSNIGKKRKVVLEHTNVNPNKAFHIGHLRNACLGDSSKKILEFLGYDVEVQYYVDDTGVQVAVAVMALKDFGISPLKDEKYDHFVSRAYVNAMEELEKNDSLKIRQNEIINSLDKQEGELAEFARILSAKVIYGNLETMHNFDIEYDLLVWESDVLLSGFWEKTFEILKKSKVFKFIEAGKNKGCWVIEGVLGSDKVIIKSNGVVTYTGKDIAYHFWKFNILNKDFLYKKWPNKLQVKPLFTTAPDGKKSNKYGKAELAVNFIDKRQSFPQQAIKESLIMLSYGELSKNLYHVDYGVVFLSSKTAKDLGVEIADEKKQQAMSGRKGIEVLADDLLDLVERKISINHPKSPAVHQTAVGSIKYYMLNCNTHSDITFDHERALDIYGNTGSYIQYTFARCVSILSKAKNKGKIINYRKSYNKQELNLNREEIEVLRSIHQFPEIVQEAGMQYAPNLICNFTFELAKKFNTFYSKHHILNDSTDSPNEDFRLLLTAAVAQVIENGLNLLGIQAPSKM